MQPIDTAILLWLNQFFGISKTFDYLVFMVSENELLKGGVLVTLLWWFWFRKDVNAQRTRDKIVVILVACVLAIGLARGLAFALPFRARPLANPVINGVWLAGGFDSNGLPPWSSFPSDHAVLFMAFVAGIWSISKKWGIAVFAYVFLMVMFPRMYLGIHYPSDILVGALIGLLTTWLLLVTPASRWLAKPALWWQENHTGTFYAALFFVTYQIGMMFEPVRDLGGFLIRALLGKL